MTKEQLFEAIGNLEEAMLDENVEHVRKGRHFGWIAAIAACALLCIGAVSLPKLLTQEEITPNSPLSEIQPTETEYVGFLEGVNYYPLPAESAPDAVCGGGDWLSPELGGAAYFTFNEASGLYQVCDPLSSAMPETGTFTREGDTITAVSYDGMESHTFFIEDDHAMTLNESTSWEKLCGRVFTSRIYAEQPFAEISADSISGIICNGWDISPDAAQMEEFAALLQNVVHYQELLAEDEPRDGGRSISFTLNKNGEASHISISYWLWMDGTKYLLDQASCDALFAFAEPLAEQARHKWTEDAKALPYQSNVTYCLLDRDYSADEPYHSFSAETGYMMEITLGQGNYRIRYINPAEEEETGCYTIEDGVLICSRGEDTHKFEILDDYTIRLIETTHEDSRCDNFLDRNFTCRLWPNQYLDTAISADDVVGVTYRLDNGGIVLQITPDTKLMEEFIACARELVIYDEVINSVTEATADTSQMVHISILQQGYENIELWIGEYILLNGKGYIYETSTAEKLLGLGERVLAGEFTEEETAEPQTANAVFGILSEYRSAEILHSYDDTARALVTGEELDTLLAHLKQIEILGRDASHETQIGCGMSVTLTRADLSKMTIIPDSDSIYVDGTWYLCTGTEDLQAFCDGMVYKNTAGGGTAGVNNSTRCLLDLS